MNNVNFSGLSATTAMRFHDELVNSISEYDAKIAALQAERIAASEDLVVVKNALLQAGHTTINIPARLEAPKSMGAQPGDDNTDQTTGEEDTKKKIGRFPKDNSLGKKMIWVISKYGKLGTQDISRFLEQHQPGIDLKNVTTICGQYVKSGTFTREYVDGSKPIYDLGAKLK
jgi:hypothetical protein